jgi:hypothetical protein
MENVRYVRVVTKASPSWVAWKEIEVLAPYEKVFSNNFGFYGTPSKIFFESTRDNN